MISTKSLKGTVHSQKSLNII